MAFDWYGTIVGIVKRFPTCSILAHFFQIPLKGRERVLTSLAQVQEL